MDRFDARILATWIKTNLEGCLDPHAVGKALSGKRSEEWRYRVGLYRILAVIRGDIITIEVFSIGHWSSIYK